ncbi:receptor-type tyrosine-protein phosphatase eta isoform X2 [Oryzias melastigma]|uniref:receptor-type tyrosine-protein phosphatase eta isoform X2 n=1 Tax=Oryzias melastigma TaxID=30732 RepID=UPI000CF7F7A3|nr:receptor-type tyrosine-protein phosphatase eta isoform X2 [Oryzias melastigma]
MVGMSPLDKASLFMCCALLLTFTVAEREYFFLPIPLTWDTARNHCQVCFKDLVTVTPENVLIIVKKINTDHWIGLRKQPSGNVTDNNNLTNTDINNLTNIVNNLTNIINRSNHSINPVNLAISYSSLANPVNSLSNNANSLSSSAGALTNNSIQLNTSKLIDSIFSNNSNSNITSNSTDTLYEAWSFWANGDPVIFQNWYPGMPQMKSPIPNINCCSCSCTCPAKPTSIMTSFVPTTDLTTTSRFWTTEKTTTETLTTFAGNTSFNESFLNIPVNATQDNTTNTNFTLNMTNPTTATTSTTIERALNTIDQSSPNTTVTTNMQKSTNQSEWNTTNNHTTEMDDFSNTTDKTSYIPTTNYTTVETTAIRTTFDALKSLTSSPWTTPQPPIEAACERSPMEAPFLVEINKNYIEDPCVVILKSGLWVERRCSEILPFICYEDRFFGYTNVSNITSESANLTWQPGPGGISHYYIEITGDLDLKENVTDLTLELFSLTAGGNYSVQVFPVKCGRFLNPLNTSFYTIPYEVNDLRVENVTERSIFLSWSKPEGKASFYLVETENHKGRNVNTTDLEFDGLIPGTCYTFTVKSGVPTQWSNEANVTSCTKPSKVSNLKATDIQDTSLTVGWKQPEGKFTVYHVTVKFNQKEQNHYVNATETNLILTDLQGGTRTTIEVAVLSNGLMGDVVEIIEYTVPERVSKLELTAEQRTIAAKWKYTIDNNTTFIAELWESNKIQELTTKNTTISFSGLKAATNYTVIVYVMKGSTKSPAERCSIFTLTVAPTNLKDIERTKNSITLKWTVPEEMKDAILLFRVSSLWSKTYNEMAEKTDNHTFKNLISGTKYYFEVRAKAGDSISESQNYSAKTEPDKMDVSLSMLCSSAEPLHCEKETEKSSVLVEIEKMLKKKFSDDIYFETPESLTSPNS